MEPYGTYLPTYLATFSFLFSTMSLSNERLYVRVDGSPWYAVLCRLDCFALAKICLSYAKRIILTTCYCPIVSPELICQIKSKILIKKIILDTLKTEMNSPTPTIVLHEKEDMILLLGSYLSR